jgi:hypothetical protein
MVGGVITLQSKPKRGGSPLPQKSQPRIMPYDKIENGMVVFTVGLTPLIHSFESLTNDRSLRLAIFLKLLNMPLKDSTSTCLFEDLEVVRFCCLKNTFDRPSQYALSAKNPYFLLKQNTSAKSGLPCTTSKSHNQ